MLILIVLNCLKNHVVWQHAKLNKQRATITDLNSSLNNFKKQDLELKKDQVVGFLEYIDTQMKTSALLKQSQQFQLIDYLISQSKTYKDILQE